MTVSGATGRRLVWRALHMAGRMAAQLAALAIAALAAAAFPRDLQYLGTMLSIGLIGASIPPIWTSAVPLSQRARAYGKAVAAVLTLGLVVPFLFEATIFFLPAEVVAAGLAVGATAAIFAGYLLARRGVRKL